MQKPPITSLIAATLFLSLLANSASAQIPTENDPTERPNIVVIMADDPQEKHDVLAENPEIAKRIKKRLAETIDAGRTRAANPNVHSKTAG